MQIVKSDLNLVEVEELMEVVQRLKANKESQIELKEQLHNYYNSTKNEINTETESIKTS